MNLEQGTKLQQQRENLNKRNQEVASMDRRVGELRDRLWKKKAALQQKENLPVSVSHFSCSHQTMHSCQLQDCIYIHAFSRHVYPKQLKGTVHLKMKILSSFTHPQVDPNLYECVCSEHKGRYSEESL